MTRSEQLSKTWTDAKARVQEAERSLNANYDYVMGAEQKLHHARASQIHLAQELAVAAHIEGEARVALSQHMHGNEAQAAQTVGRCEPTGDGSFRCGPRGGEDGEDNVAGRQAPLV